MVSTLASCMAPHACTPSLFKLSVIHYYVCTRVLRKPGHRTGPTSSHGSRVKLSTGGVGPCWRVGSGGNVLRAGADGGQRLLAAVQEGWIVRALMAAVVGVRLPSLALLFPLASEDPNEGLREKKQQKAVEGFPKSSKLGTSRALPAWTLGCSRGRWWGLNSCWSSPAKIWLWKTFQVDEGWGWMTLHKHTRAMLQLLPERHQL